MNEFTTFANELADLSGECIRKYFRKAYSSETKADKSPVTQADREAEKLMRAAIMKQFPSHGIWGEEFGKHNEAAYYTWVLDPVDGTKSFIAGFPTFGTLIGLVHKQIPVLGVINQPISGERWIGGKGVPTTLNGKAVKSKSSVRLKDAIFSTTSPDLIRQTEREGFLRVRAAAAQTVYGYDCYAYAMLASGHVDVVIETGLQPHDFCALAPILQSASAVMTDWVGNNITERSDGRVVACANEQLHAEVMKLLK